MTPQYVEFTRGYIAYLAGSADSAAAAFRRAIAIDGELSTAYAQLGETNSHLVPDDLNLDAQADAACALARAFDTSATHLLLHPIEIAWRRREARHQTLNTDAVGASVTERYAPTRKFTMAIASPFVPWLASVNQQGDAPAV